MTTITNNKRCGICADCVPQINGGSGFNNCAEAHAAQMAEDKVMDNKLTGLGANHPANGPLTTERLGHVRDVLQRNLQYSNGGSMDYIVADAVKAIDELLAGRKAEPVAYMHHSGQVITREECCDDEVFAICCKVETPLYVAPIAPPAPVVMKDHQIRELVNELRDIAVEYHGTQQLREHIARKVRAAMLNHSGDVTEVGESIKQQSSIHTSNGAMSGDAVKQPSNNASSLVFVDEIAEQNGVDPAITDVYMQGYHDSEGRKSAPVDNDDLREAVSDLLAALDEYPEQLVPINRKSFLVRTIRAAMLQGVQPVTTAYKLQDGWVAVPVEPTEAMLNAWLSEVANWRGHVAGYKAMVAAAPKQEARKSNVIGSYQVADGQEHPIVSLSSPQQEA